MDYEKAYKDALERAKLSRLQLLDIGEEATEIEYIFPELKESEDERIRKAIIGHIKGLHYYDSYYGVTPDEMIAWLEKQGEKSQFDKERLMEVAKFETFEEQIKHWQRTCSIAEKIGKELLEKQGEQKQKWTEEDEKYIDNCCLLIGAADDCYEKTFKDDCIHYLQSIKERIAWKSMPIKQKDIDKLVFNFKWSNENFKNKRVTDIYRQGIYDVMELLKQRMEL